MSERMFPLGFALTIASGTLLCSPGTLRRGLSWMVGEEVYDHQINRAIDACRSFVLVRHPELVDFNAAGITGDNWRVKLAAAESKFGHVLPLDQLPIGWYLHVDPVDEMGALMGDQNVIVANVDEAGSGKP